MCRVIFFEEFILKLMIKLGVEIERYRSELGVRIWFFNEGRGWGLDFWVFCGGGS